MSRETIYNDDGLLLFGELALSRIRPRKTKTTEYLFGGKNRRDRSLEFQHSCARRRAKTVCSREKAG